VWILDTDLAAAFDRIDHDQLLAGLGTFPARGLVRQWLKAGIVERGRFTPTEEGTPQGGVISPVLLNIALHGMETAAGVRYHPSGRRAGEIMPNAPVLVRYADDLVAMCHSRAAAEQVKARLAEWLAPRGLVTPSRSSIYRCLVSRPQGKPNSSAGTGRSKKLTPAAERKQENGNRITGSAASGSRITGRIQEDAWPERELTWIW
jgi:hypothetical protein